MTRTSRQKWAAANERFGAKIALKMVGGRNNQTRNKFSSAILSELQKIKSEK